MVRTSGGSTLSVTLLYLLVQASLGASSTTLIDAVGSLNKGAPPLPATGGVVAVLTSPGGGTPSGVGAFPDADAVTAAVEGTDGPVVITSPGATLGGSATSGLARGSGASAAAAVAGSVVLSGVTAADVEVGLAETRHGRTLAGLFESKLQIGGEGEKTLLIIAVQVGEGEEEPDEATVKEGIEALFDAEAAAAGVEKGMNDVYEIEVKTIRNEEDVSKVMNAASAAASRSSLSSTGNVSAAVVDAYAKISSSSADSSPVVEAIHACDDAYFRHSRAARAKMNPWKGRSARGLAVEKFGTNAEMLLKRTVALYDRDTMAAAGLPPAAEYRLEKRSKLQALVEKGIRELFAAQVSNLEKTTMKKFNAVLLGKVNKGKEGTQDFYNDNASALRSASFAFESAMNELEIPSLGLTKSRASQEMSGKLNSALIGFSDSPAAKLKLMQAVQRTASKQKKPTERSIDAGLDLVAMIRPDGFGSFQGFAGYQLGSNSITVGVHNDADAPEVISQFGGTRPPFIRIQPKLKLDVEL